MARLDNARGGQTRGGECWDPWSQHITIDKNLIHTDLTKRYAQTGSQTLAGYEMDGAGLAGTDGRREYDGEF